MSFYQKLIPLWHYDDIFFVIFIGKLSMIFEYITHFLKSKSAAVSIEYCVGLALFGIVMAQSFNTTGTALSGYMSKIAAG